MSLIITKEKEFQKNNAWSSLTTFSLGSGCSALYLCPGWIFLRAALKEDPSLNEEWPIVKKFYVAQAGRCSRVVLIPNNFWFVLD